ncbi:MAG TPA: peptidoglycan editing factor PgeF [Acidobacteriaceae bacterium]|nr:peptidoglycan editing factor PgeF [Acidobacteriaceae bacterium]
MASSRSASADLQAVDVLLRSGGLAPGRRLLRGEGMKRRGERNQPVELPPQKPRRVVKSQIEIVRAAGWQEIPWLVHGFSTRTGGATHAYRPEQRAAELNLGFTQSDARENVLENRRRFLEALGAPEARLVTLRQIHSSLVRRVKRADAERVPAWKGDGMMTDEPGALLAIQTADCIPVLVADTKRRAVAAFHAGWRGTLKRIVEAGVNRMRLEFGSRPENLVAAIGPGIGVCCYAVGEEVRSEFSSQFAYASDLFHEVSDSDPVRERYPLLFLTARAPGHSNLGPSLHLDLMEANRRQLLDAGLRADAITVTGDCTRCQNNRYFSYRAEQGFTGRMLSVVGRRDRASQGGRR